MSQPAEVFPFSAAVLRAPLLGFVDLGDDDRPHQGVSYTVVPADSDAVGARPVVDGEHYFEMDIQGFYSGDMPDITETNEGLLRLEVDVRDPQSTSTSKRAAQLVNFTVRDYDNAGGFLARGAFRRVVFGRHVNLHVTLVELDADLSEYFNKVETVVRDSGLAEVDVISSIPYLDVAAKLVGSIVKNFGRNPDDPIWEERMLLETEPLPGSPFLRTGMYIMVDRHALVEQFGSDPVPQLVLRDGVLYAGKEPDSRSVTAAHFRFSVRVRSADETLNSALIAAPDA
ncbi:hypothetical protein [Cryobacterium sp. AP23]